MVLARLYLQVQKKMQQSSEMLDIRNRMQQLSTSDLPTSDAVIYRKAYIALQLTKLVSSSGYRHFSLDIIYMTI